jgi:hypothetical protein
MAETAALHEPDPLRMASRRWFLLRSKRELLAQITATVRRKRNLAGIQNPYARRAEEVAVADLEDNNRRSLRTLNAVIDRHNALCKAWNDPDLQV